VSYISHIFWCFSSAVCEVQGEWDDVSVSYTRPICCVSVRRFVKYTGYGNAAGLLAQRGLMGGGRGSSALYSSESDDSDTEEYLELQDK
jgi:hypothetical protein